MMDIIVAAAAAAELRLALSAAGDQGAYPSASGKPLRPQLAHTIHRIAWVVRPCWKVFIAAYSGTLDLSSWIFERDHWLSDRELL